MPSVIFEHLIPAAGLAALFVAAAGCTVESDEQAPSGPIDDGQSDDPIPEGANCTSELVDFGLLCTTCPGIEEPECLAAHCTIRDRCLDCTDPRGRTGKDCSMDHVLTGSSITVGSGDTFNSCWMAWGELGGTTGVCQYAGTETCEVTEYHDDWVCISCSHELGSGSGKCAAEAELPEQMAGRPSWLPEPGECVNEYGDDGELKCSTCTRDDLSAATICRFPPATYCDAVHEGQTVHLCLECSLEGGGSVRLCDGAGT